MSQPPSFADLSLPEKRMLLAELLRRKANEDAAFPLSHGQRGLWFLHQLDPDSTAYNLFFPARIRARLDVPAFHRALQTLVERHPSLRTTFEHGDGEPRQRVHALSPPTALPLDLGGEGSRFLPSPPVLRGRGAGGEGGWFVLHDAETWSEDALRTRVEEEAYRPFDLERGPLIRMHLFARSPEDFIFLITAHHLVGDFWSLVLLMEEMQELYPAECAGTPRRLPPPPRRYCDFVRWQSETLASAEGERLASYWEKQLAGVSPVLELPTDHPRRQAGGSPRGGAEGIRLEPELTRRVKGLAAAEGVTPYSVLLAAFQVLLSRYSGQDDFVIGSPFAGRSRAEFERVVGYFINMLPLRARLGGDPSFRTVLRQTGTTVVEALQHQDYPFPLMVERLKLPRDPSRPPLVQASFTLEKAHRPVGLGSWSFFLPQAEVRLNVSGLSAEPYPLAHRTSQMDLEMVLEEGDGVIYGMLRYNADLFDEATIQRLMEHYRILLQSALDDPQKSISELRLLTPSEERLLLYEWNNTHADYPRDICLHHLFEQQVAKTPQAIALRQGERIVRYGELDAWANRLAEVLRQRGVGCGTLAALCLERSPEMIAAILGVLKSGAAYVPLDPAAPWERLHGILTETRAPVVLTQQDLANRLHGVEAEILLVEADAPQSGATCVPTRSVGTRESKPEDLAYVIYTSGSTGKPKGVMVEHRAICNTICWHQDALKVHPDDRLLLLVPYVFDASIAIVFPALAAGAELVLAEANEERDPARIRERIRRDRVTILPILPRMLRLLLDERLPEAGRTLRYVYCGGEAMPPDLPERLFAFLDVPLYNLYGPTETAIDATYWQCRKGDERPTIPIGLPIANVQVYVLDPHRKPQPVGVAGELYVGGAGLARGYLHDPELTANRFITDPFCPDKGARLYRTGDRCRRLSDGSLEFLGRLDGQVKLNGHRIEIGEIEAHLAAHPAVAESAVLVLSDDSKQRLAAYVSARSGAGLPTPAVLRRYLRERLPEYMVPSAIVLLPSLPHTPSGKVDYKALPQPLAERAADQPFVAPRTPLEKYLAEVWRELLGVSTLGIHDNFFALGGNSIQGAILINRVQEKLGQQVYTVALFDAPTIAGLAEYLMKRCPDVIREQFGEKSLYVGWGERSETHHDAAAGSRSSTHPTSNLLVALQPNGARPACFLVHPPGGIVVCYQALAQYLGEDRPVYGIRSRGLHGETELPESLEKMAAEYVAIIRAAQAQGPYHLGGWSMGGLVAFEMAQQLRAQGESVGILALLDTTIPWNEANAPFAEDAAESAREYGLDLTLAELDRLGPDEQLPYLWDHVRKLGLIDDETPLALAQQILDDLKRLFHWHIRLGSEYALQPYAGHLTLFRPSDSPVVINTSEDRNWRKISSEVEVHFVPGLHHTMVKEPYVQTLARQLRQCLTSWD